MHFRTLGTTFASLLIFIAPTYADTLDSPEWCKQVLRSASKATRDALLKGATSGLVLSSDEIKGFDDRPPETFPSDFFVESMHALYLLGLSPIEIQDLVVPRLKRYFRHYDYTPSDDQINLLTRTDLSSLTNPRALAFEEIYFPPRTRNLFQSILDAPVQIQRRRWGAVESLFGVSQRVGHEDYARKFFLLIPSTYGNLPHVPLKPHEISGRQRIVSALTRIHRFVFGNSQYKWNHNDARSAILDLAAIDRESEDWPFAEKLLLDFSEFLDELKAPANSTISSEQGELALMAIAAIGQIDYYFPVDSSQIHFGSRATDHTLRARAQALISKHSQEITKKLGYFTGEFRDFGLATPYDWLHYFIWTLDPNNESTHLKSLIRNLRRYPISDSFYQRLATEGGTNAHVRVEIDKLAKLVRAPLAGMIKYDLMSKAASFESRDLNYAFNLYINAGDLDAAERVARENIESGTGGYNGFSQLWKVLMLRQQSHIFSPWWAE